MRNKINKKKNYLHFFLKDKIANRNETGIENRTERERNRNGYGTEKERKWNENGNGTRMEMEREWKWNGTVKNGNGTVTKESL